jgi:uncharacterized protein YqhQ
MAKSSTKSVKRTTIGGQALIEGILMRGPHKSAMVVRKPEGDLAVKESPSGGGAPGVWAKIPVARGAINFVRSMQYGFAAINWSASFFPDDAPDPGHTPGRFEAWLDKKMQNPKAEKIAMAVAMAFGVITPLALFILLPTLAAGLLGEAVPVVARNLIEGALRVGAFLLFLFVVSKQKDIRRTFMYHGAEHKSIACYEAGEPLTVENVRKHTRFHPRCGTSFLFVVMIVSILFYSLFSWSNPWQRMAIRLAFLPVVVGLSYEINRFTGRSDSRLSRIIRAPGLWLQRFTTYEPEDAMMAVAIDALTRVIPEDDSDNW